MLQDTQADAATAAPAASLPPPREHLRTKRIRIENSEIEVGATTFGVNGAGSTLVCKAEVSVRACALPYMGSMKLSLPDLTPSQARQIAGFLVDAAAFAEGGAL